jgi:hypothetical protein
MKLIHPEDAQKIWRQIKGYKKVAYRSCPRVTHLTNILCKAIYADDLFSARLIVEEIHNECKQPKNAQNA